MKAACKGKRKKIFLVAGRFLLKQMLDVELKFFGTVEVFR
jgi:hypothetical protein